MVTRNIYATFRSAVLLTSMLCLALGLIPVSASAPPMGRTTNQTTDSNCSAASAIYELRFSPDGKKLAFSKVSSDLSPYCIQVWDLQSAQPLLEIISQTDKEFEISVFSFAFTQDSTGLVFSRRIPIPNDPNARGKQQVEVWSLITGKREQMIPIDFAVTNELVDKLEIVPGSPLLFLNTSSYTFAYDLKAKVVKHKFNAIYGGEVNWLQMKIDDSGRYVLTSDQVDLRKFLWDVQSGKLIHTFDCTPDADFVPNSSNIVMTVCNPKALSMWSIDSMSELWRRTLLTDSNLYHKQLSQAGKYALDNGVERIDQQESEPSSPFVMVIDLTSGQIVQRIQTDERREGTAAFVRTEAEDIIVVNDQTNNRREVRAWSPKDRKWLKTFRSYASDRGIRIFPTANQGEFALIRTSETTYTSWIEIWRVTDDKPYATFR